MKIIFEKPDREAPGYLRRQRQVLELRQRITGDLTPESIDIMVEFLLPYVREPEDRDQAREALWDASQEQFDEMLSALTSANPT